MSKQSKRREALIYHAKPIPGKIKVVPTKKYASQRDLSLAYSPGVAEPCLEIAKDILSCVPDVVDKYKELIDRGFDTTFKEGLQLERKVFAEHARTVSANAVAKRRKGIIKRGRDQKKQ